MTARTSGRTIGATMVMWVNGLLFSKKLSFSSQT
jgi:hypothetical protein